MLKTFNTVQASNYHEHGRKNTVVSMGFIVKNAVARQWNSRHVNTGDSWLKYFLENILAVYLAWRLI